MARQEQQQPWWELPAKAPGEPEYEREREHLRSELARAWRAGINGQELHERTQAHSARPAAA